MITTKNLNYHGPETPPGTKAPWADKPAPEKGKWSRELYDKVMVELRALELAVEAQLRLVRAELEKGRPQ